MKEISMKEAMRAVADGKCVHYEAHNGSSGILFTRVGDDRVISFLPSTRYFFKETVKVALFKSKGTAPDIKCFTELDPQGSDFQKYFDRASDWVEIEVKK